MATDQNIPQEAAANRPRDLLLSYKSQSPNSWRLSLSASQGRVNPLHLPSYSPELNPVENIWQFLRQNHLGNRVFESYTDIVDACCAAWNALAAESEVKDLGIKVTIVEPGGFATEWSTTSAHRAHRPPPSASKLR